MGHLFDLAYWFNLRPAPLSSSGRTMFAGLLLVFFVAIITIFLAKKKMGIYRGFFRKISDFCVGNLIIGGIIFFFNYEIIPFFSARFWLLLWALVMAVWMYFIIKSLKKVKATKAALGQIDEFNKYLP
jgi:hypothetical protein